MTRPPLFTDRRALLKGAAAGAICAGLPWNATWANAGALPQKAMPVSLADVRLLPGPFADAVEANRKYLLSLEADRLLHNFRKFAGLTPKGEAYGGWEADTIAGHSLGHYLSALALIHAQTGDSEARQRAIYIVSELSEVQAKQGD